LKKFHQNKEVKLQDIKDKIIKSISLSANLLMPGLILALSVICFYAIDKLPHIELVFLHYSFYVLALLAFAITCFFKYSRPAFFIITLCFAYLLINYIKFNKGDAFSSSIEYKALCFFIPLNLFIFSFQPLKGIFNKNGLIKFLFILTQFTLIDFYTNRIGSLYSKETVDLYLSNIDSFFSYKIFGDYLFNTIPNLALFLFVITITNLIIRAALSGATIDYSLLCVSITCFMATAYSKNSTALAIFYSASCLIIIISIIQHIRYIAYHDILTKAPTRLALFSDIKRLPNKYSVALIDIDDFKNFNDNFSHDVGDKVLTMTAKELAKIGGKGQLYRYGGEEFVIIFPNLTKNEAFGHLEEIRKKISEAKFVLEENSDKKQKNYNITISIGVAEKKRSDASINPVIKRADKAMYKAKENGKNLTLKG
jgi:diguanylate cyclase (GGDEF)-like protein